MTRSVHCLVLALLLAFAASSALAAELHHAVALHGEPKYGPDFEHFDYVNPEALKGGDVRMYALATYDTFNPFIPKGVAATGLGLIYDTLSTKSWDEPFTEYGLLAEHIELPEDRSYVTFHLREEARFHDGHPVTAEDVVFSFEFLMEHGDPLYKQYYGDVASVEAVSEREVTFAFHEGTVNAELPLILGQLAIMPKHFWETEDNDSTAADLTIPLGSGPYRIADFDAGRWVRYERVPDYWAKDLPVNKGSHNFGSLRYDYYRDATVALTAFLAKEYDFRQENVAKQWATGYAGPAVQEGRIMKEEIPHELNQGMQAFIYNTRRELFADERVRRALAHAFDFEWTNQNIFYGQYVRSESYFSNSELAATGLPEGDELAILKDYEDRLDPVVFTEAYRAPSTDGPGGIRANLRTALGLLREAGWEVDPDSRKLVKDGKPFSFELLIVQPTLERVALPFRKNLERLGIEMAIRVVDASQYVNRVRSFDFDMMTGVLAQSESPGNEQRIYWTSEAATTPGSRNYAGIEDPVVDELVERVIRSESRADLVTACRALDRVLLHGDYVIPQYHSNHFRVAYWDKFDRPEIAPDYSLGFETWWVVPEKAERLEDEGYTR
jgi:microcin C transport system substrate-binding protein